MSSPASSRAEADSGAVPSPCISVCRIDPGTGWCEGCWRTIDEIAHWSLFDDDERRAVWTELNLRRAMPRCSPAGLSAIARSSVGEQPTRTKGER